MKRVTWISVILFGIQELSLYTMIALDILNIYSWLIKFYLDTFDLSICFLHPVYH